MAKRNRSLLRHLGWLAGLEVVGYALLTNRYGASVRGIGTFALLSIVVILLWLLFVMPTHCDFEVRGRGCRRPVFGKASGCHNHARAKRDAMFSALQMRNPGMAVRVLWSDGAQTGRAVGTQAVPALPVAESGFASNRGQALFNLASLFVAIVAAAAGVLALF